MHTALMAAQWYTCTIRRESPERMQSNGDYHHSFIYWPHSSISLFSFPSGLEASKMRKLKYVYVQSASLHKTLKKYGHVSMYVDYC